MSLKTAPAQLTAGDAELRGQYLREVLAVLYPDTTGDAGSSKIAEYLVIPDARRPKLLVPVGSRRVAAAAVRRFSEPQSRLARLKRFAVVMALRSGTWPVLLRDRVRLNAAEGGDSIDGYLRRTLLAELSVSIHIGPARANRKPVLQLLDPSGHTIGFAKLGTGPLTRRLVRAETAALAALSHVKLRQVAVPGVLHAGQWRGHQVLVQSPLPIWQPREQLTSRRLVEAMLEVAGACGTSQGWLATSPYWADLRGRLSQLSESAEGTALHQATRKLVGHYCELGMCYGAWHGDWAPWNMANVADALLLWDWERFTPGVPIGFDALHHDLQRRLQAGVEPRDAVEQMVRNAAGLLSHFPVPPGSAETTALLYLADLATRYLADRQAEAGARLGVLGTWLLPVLVERVGRL